MKSSLLLIDSISYQRKTADQDFTEISTGNMTKINYSTFSTKYSNTSSETLNVNETLNIKETLNVNGTFILNETLNLNETSVNKPNSSNNSVYLLFYVLSFLIVCSTFVTLCFVFMFVKFRKRRKKSIKPRSDRNHVEMYGNFEYDEEYDYVNVEGNYDVTYEQVKSNLFDFIECLLLLSLLLLDAKFYNHMPVHVSLVKIESIFPNLSQIFSRLNNLYLEVFCRPLPGCNRLIWIFAW